MSIEAVVTEPATETVINLSQRVRDYVQLTKPRIGVLELVTVTVGALVAVSPPVALRQGPSDWLLDAWLLVHALVGTALIVSSASAWNMLLERKSDAHMRRTRTRPLPAGRLSEGEVIVFGVLTGVLGLGYLALAVNVTTATIAGISWLLYVAVYTPMKPRTIANTIVGAIPGGLPIVMGWTAMDQPWYAAEAWALFGIVFCWQFPHFMAIAWLCRTDYAEAGLRMLPEFDPTGRWTGLTATVGAIACWAVSLLPTYLGVVGWLYAGLASLLGLALLAWSVRFQWEPTDARARTLLRASLLYLPLVLLALVLTLPPL